MLRAYTTVVTLQERAISQRAGTSARISGTGRNRRSTAAPAPPTHRVSHASAVATVVLAFAALVAAASDGTPLRALLRQGDVDRLEVLLGVAVLGGVAGSLATVAAVVFHRIRYGGAGHGPPLWATLLRSLPVIGAVVTAFTLMVLTQTKLAPIQPGPARRGRVVRMPGRAARPSSLEWWGGMAVAGRGQDAGSASPGAGGTSGSMLPLWLLLSAAFLAAGALAYAWRRERRERTSKADEEPPDANRETVQGALTAIIDAMLADPDPTTAIRGAYARLLELLDVLGTGRRRQEGPMEHLRRTLRSLDVPVAPLRELVRLFTLARFSIRPLTAAHREQALGALRLVVGDLAGDAGLVGAAAKTAHGTSDP